MPFVNNKVSEGSVPLYLKIKSVPLLLILFYCYQVVAPLEASRGSRKHFLSHGPSVQSYGRGETAAASIPGTDDISGYFYNPSNIGRIKRGSLSVAHYILYDGAMYNFFSLGQTLSDRTIIAFSGINLRSGDIELRGAIDSNPRTVQTSQWLVTGTFAADLRELPGGCLVGLNLNYLYFDFDGVSAGNIGLDAGISRSFKGPFILGNRSYIHLGLSGQSIIRPVIQLKSEKEVYPTTGRLGVALSLPMFFRYNPTKQTFHYDKANIYLDTVYDQDTGDKVGILWGFEYLILNRYAIRCGFNETLTLGAGARAGDYQFNYAIDFKPYTYFHRIGVAFYWGEAVEEEDEDFAHFMAVYQRVERLARIQLKTARELIDKGNYDSAISILERSRYLLPDKNLEVVNLLKQARDLNIAQKVLEARNKAMEEFQRGDILSAWRTLVESLNVSGDNPDTKALIERMSAEAAKRGLKINQLKQNTVDTLVSRIKSDLSFEDFESAGMNLSKLKTLDGESFVFYDIKKQIEEAKKNYVSSSILKTESELHEKKNYSEAIIAAERVLAIEPDNERAQGLRRKAGSIVLKKKKISTKDRLYSERLYYTAAEHWAKNEDRKAKEVIFELIRFNPAQDYAYPLFFRLTKEEEKKKIAPGIKLKDDELEALKFEYEKTLLENRIKEFVLAANLARQSGDIVKAYQLYLNGYDLNPDDKGICLELKKIYEEVKPKKKTRHPAPRPGEWMEMAYEAEEERGGYKLPPLEGRDKDGQELKEIEKIRADYINSVRRAAEVLASKGDYQGLERSLKKLKLFMSEGEIEKLLFLLKR